MLSKFYSIHFFHPSGIPVNKFSAATIACVITCKRSIKGNRHLHVWTCGGLVNATFESENGERLYEEWNRSSESARWTINLIMVWFLDICISKRSKSQKNCRNRSFYVSFKLRALIELGVKSCSTKTHQKCCRASSINWVACFNTL